MTAILYYKNKSVKVIPISEYKPFAYETDLQSRHISFSEPENPENFIPKVQVEFQGFRIDADTVFYKQIS